MRKAYLILGVFFGALGIEYHKYGNVYFSDNILPLVESARACLNWHDHQLQTVNATFSGWPWDPSKEETHLVLIIDSKTDIDAVNIIIKGDFVLPSGYDQNFTLDVPFCPSEDSCFISANESFTKNVMWPKESFLEYANLVTSADLTLQATSVQGKDVFCIQLSTNATEIKALIGT
ncbi:uncharacterized protein [Oscarella lobularis]|uniref:uncharacterized protein n=1 Tax=Oscarella lobularis TaxID=121494 RepID=UPI003313A803